MEEVEVDEEYLIARARLEHKKVSMHKEDLYMARVRVLVKVTFVIDSDRKHFHAIKTINDLPTDGSMEVVYGDMRRQRHES